MACIQLSFTITKASIIVSTSNRLVPPARNDLSAFLRELNWLKTLLRVITKDSDIVDVFPQALQKHIAGVVVNCELVLAGVQRGLDKHFDSGPMNKTKWALTGVEDVAKLRQKLEGYESACEVPLDTIALTITTDAKIVTQNLHDDKTAVDNCVSNIVAEIGRLQHDLGAEGTSVNLSTTSKPSLKRSIGIPGLEGLSSTPSSSLSVEEQQLDQSLLRLSLGRRPTHIELQPSASLSPPRMSAFRSTSPRSLTPSPRVRFAETLSDDVLLAASKTVSFDRNEPHPNSADSETQFAESDQADKLENQTEQSWIQNLNSGCLLDKVDDDGVKSRSAPMLRQPSSIAQRETELVSEATSIRMEEQRSTMMRFDEIRRRRRDSAANSLSQKSDDNSVSSPNDGRVPSWMNALHADGEEPYPVMIAGFDCTWVIGKTVGIGSRGTVNICERQRSGQLAVVKMYRRTRQRDGFLPDKRLNREITILSLLNHPHIVEYRYSGQVGQYQYILLEYVSNGTLSEYCAKAQGLEEKQVRKFARQIGSALQYCHTNLIVHGSLNADKVLITSAGDVKIAGFGTSTFNNGGGYEADTAAYGMLIWSMMSNERPIQFEDVLRYQLSPSASWGCFYLLQNLFHKDFAQRYDLKAALADPWMRLGHIETVQSFVPQRAPPAAPLNNSVIQKINDLGIRSMSEELNNLLNSPGYRTASAEWRKRRRERTSPRKRGLLGFISKDKVAKDNHESFHLQFDLRNHLSIPALAVYYLVQEKQPLRV